MVERKGLFAFDVAPSSYPIPFKICPSETVAFKVTIVYHVTKSYCNWSLVFFLLVLSASFITIDNSDVKKVNMVDILYIQE
jgi:hypothetical protein